MPLSDDKLRDHPAVLLVDDDPFARSTMKMMLELLKFTVHEADDGIQAIHLARSKTLGFHFIVSDFNMPTLDGVETLGAIRSRHPGMKAILCSGQSEWDCLQGQPLLDGIFLSKPFGFHELSEAVAHILSKD
jgi:DNA-binding NtrC family response regulator